MRLISMILFTLLMAAGWARAQVCTFSMTPVDFGSVNLGLSGISPVTGTMSATCAGTPNAEITICPNIMAGTGGTAGGDPRYLTQGTFQAPYNLYSDAALSNVWGSYLWGNPQRPPNVSVALNGAGTGSVNRTVYAAISGTIQGAIAGPYVSNFTGSHTLFDYGYAPAHQCTSVSPRALPVTFSVVAQNNGACNVNATELNFGDQSSLSTAKTASGTVSVTCTAGVAYWVGLSNGINGGLSPTARYMARPASAQKITYGIFRNAARTLPWGLSVGSDTISGTGNGTTQSYPAYGLISPQATPAPGGYSDLIVVTVTY